LVARELYDNLDGTIENRAATFQGLVEYEDDRPTLPESTASTGEGADERFVRVFDESGGVTFDGSIQQAERRSTTRRLSGHRGVTRAHGR
jgi:hypothetical protein